jgi:AraC-like DNA-binding protein
MPGVKVVRHENETARWEVARRLPALPLRPYLQAVPEGWTSAAGPTAALREVPIPGVPVILNLGSKWNIETAGRKVALDSFTGGLSTVPSFVRGASSWACIELRLTPLGARRLFGRPMHELWNQVVPLEEVLPRSEDLVDRLREAPSWSARFELLDDFLLQRLARSVDPSPEVEWSWARLHGSHGRAPIGELADELGWSHRRLIARFRDQVGLAPKTFARVIRFDRAVRQLRAATTRSLAEIALDCGYFDQAHLNREFREFAGTTPGALVAARLDSGGIAA